MDGSRRLRSVAGEPCLLRPLQSRKQQLLQLLNVLLQRADLAAGGGSRRCAGLWLAAAGGGGGEGVPSAGLACSGGAEIAARGPFAGASLHFIEAFHFTIIEASHNPGQQPASPPAAVRSPLLTPHFAAPLLHRRWSPSTACPGARRPCVRGPHAAHGGSCIIRPQAAGAGGAGGEPGWSGSRRPSATGAVLAFQNCCLPWPDHIMHLASYPLLATHAPNPSHLGTVLVGVELAQIAAARRCAYLRCSNVEAEGGPAAGQGTGSMRCGACRAAWYCGTACSHADWRGAGGGGHQRVCKALCAVRLQQRAPAEQGVQGMA